MLSCSNENEMETNSCGGKRPLVDATRRPCEIALDLKVWAAQMKRVFLSFKMEDKKQVDGVRLLSWHKHVSLEFYDESVRIAYKSENAPYIRSKIREKINRSSVTVCLLGQNTHQSEWVNWELETSVELKKAVILMGLPNGPTSLKLPAAVRGQTWWLWDIDHLQRLIEQA